MGRKGKTLTMAVKNVSVDGATLEYTWMAKLKGLDIALTFTGTKVADSLGAGATVGQGVFFTKEGDMVMVKSFGYGRPKQGQGKSIEIWSFIAVSQNLNWLNSTITVVTIEGDDQWKEFDVTINEWNTPQS